MILTLVLISESDWATANPITTNGYRKECEYFIYYFPHFPLVPSLVPSVSAASLASYNSDVISNSSASNPGWCTIECRSLYTLHSYCIGKYYADLVASYYCGSYQNVPCSSYNNYNLINDVYGSCNSSTSCSDSCLHATIALENYIYTAAAAIQTR